MKQLTVALLLSLLFVAQDSNCDNNDGENLANAHIDKLKKLNKYKKRIQDEFSDPNKLLNEITEILFNGFVEIIDASKPDDLDWACDQYIFDLKRNFFTNYINHENPDSKLSTTDEKVFRDFISSDYFQNRYKILYWRKPSVEYQKKMRYVLLVTYSYIYNKLIEHIRSTESFLVYKHQLDKFLTPSFFSTFSGSMRPALPYPNKINTDKEREEKTELILQSYAYAIVLMHVNMLKIELEEEVNFWSCDLGYLNNKEFINYVNNFKEEEMEKNVDLCIKMLPQKHYDVLGSFCGQVLILANLISEHGPNKKELIEKFKRNYVDYNSDVVKMYNDPERKGDVICVNVDEMAEYFSFSKNILKPWEIEKNDVSP